MNEKKPAGAGTRGESAAMSRRTDRKDGGTPLNAKPQSFKKKPAPAGAKPQGFKKEPTPAGAKPQGFKKEPTRAGAKPQGFRKQPASAGAKPQSIRKQPARAETKPQSIKKPTAPMEGMASRRLALKVIRQVTEEGAFASLSLDNALRGCGLNNADRSLVSRLAYDTLDHLIYLDFVLGQVMAREDTDIRLRNILRLGACQILIEDRIPESAATNTSVELCAELGMAGLKGVCNGILRNLIRKKDELVFPDPEKEPEKADALRYSMPEWLWRKLKDEYGEEAHRIASFRKEKEGWTIRPNLLLMSDEEFETLLEKKIWGHEKLDLPHAWRITGAMDIANDADFRAGRFSIQSPGSMAACLAVDARRGQHVLDCCAAPGGKSCYLAEIMGGTGRVQAWDLHEHRTKLIEAQAKRLGLENVRPMARDAAKPREDLNGTLDAVLLDAPCSGTGMLAEKPDLKLRLTEESVEELRALQEKLLDTVCAYVKEGGTLVYSTCSVLKEENEQQAERFLARHPEFEEAELPDSIPERYRAHRGRGLQLLEHRDGAEGFYIIRMRRKHD